MSTPLNSHNLKTMIAQDSSAITELKALLLHEREQLEQRELGELPAIVARKDQLLESIAISAKQREAMMQSIGLKPNSASWEKLLESNDSTRELLEPWRALMVEFSECKTLNEINGKMIGRSRQILGQLLNLIRGQVAAPQLYTNTGTTTGGGGSRCVAEA
jgi:flagella synthesis protein FlgN